MTTIEITGEVYATSGLPSGPTSRALAVPQGSSRIVRVRPPAYLPENLTAAPHWCSAR